MGTAEQGTKWPPGGRFEYYPNPEELTTAEALRQGNFRSSSDATIINPTKDSLGYVIERVSPTKKTVGHTPLELFNASFQYRGTLQVALAYADETSYGHVPSMGPGMVDMIAANFDTPPATDENLTNPQLQLIRNNVHHDGNAINTRHYIFRTGPSYWSVYSLDHNHLNKQQVDDNWRGFRFMRNSILASFVLNPEAHVVITTKEGTSPLSIAAHPT